MKLNDDTQKFRVFDCFSVVLAVQQNNEKIILKPKLRPRLHKYFLIYIVLPKYLFFTFPYF